ncbi:hypothetical protein BC940DRAFT_353472 [Gongronella butleri]|nr:hypothetical protein BC940DRAFT_353472 [Gongronella butleri]
MQASLVAADFWIFSSCLPCFVKRPPFMSSDRQNSASSTKHRGLIDPTCIFDPDIILLPSQQEGFRLLFPDWGEKSILDRPTIIEMQRMLKGVDLTKITKRSVILADYALTPSPYSPSTQKDSTRFRKYSRVPLDTQTNHLTPSIDNADITRNGRAFASRQGRATAKDIAGAIHYLKGFIAAGTPPSSFYIFSEGLMATRLADVHFAPKSSERETLIKESEDWLSSTNLPYLILCEAIAVDLFGISYSDFHTEAEIPLEIPLDHTIKDAVALFVFGKSETRNITFPKRTVTLEELVEKGYTVDLFERHPMFSVNNHKITIGKFSYRHMLIALCLCPVKKSDESFTIPQTPVYQLLCIYACLCSTPVSFKLAVDMGIIDYDNFTAVKRVLTTHDGWCCSDAVTSQHGYEYAKLCRTFYGWRQRIKRDFSNSLTRDAFALLVTMTALIVSFTGIISVAQAFASN